VQCTNCGTSIVQGHKLNAHKETTDEEYNGITIYRFYIECTECSQEITFKTDPQTNDYQAEKGGKRIMGIDKDAV
jgi:DNA-directed RNA polymerase subunit RPC12/RpoP